MEIDTYDHVDTGTGELLIYSTQINVVNKINPKTVLSERNQRTTKERVSIGEFP